MSIIGDLVTTIENNVQTVATDNIQKQVEPVVIKYFGIGVALGILGTIVVCWLLRK